MIAITGQLGKWGHADIKSVHVLTTVSLFSQRSGPINTLRLLVQFPSWLINVTFSFIKLWPLAHLSSFYFCSISRHFSKVCKSRCGFLQMEVNRRLLAELPVIKGRKVRRDCSTRQLRHLGNDPVQWWIVTACSTITTHWRIPPATVSDCLHAWKHNHQSPLRSNTLT